MSQRRDRVPDILVERLALGELPPGRAEAVRAELLAEPDGAARLAALAADDDASRAQYPPRVVAAEVDRRAGLARPRRRPFLAWSGAAAAVAVALVVWLAWPGVVGPPEPAGPGGPILDGGGRVKGDPVLFVHRKSPSGPDALASGASAQAGDQLQLSYLAGNAGYGVILSVDGRGAVTLHYPRDERASTALGHQGTQSLPFSYELDDAPRFERFFFVTSDRPVDVVAVLDAARRIAGDPRRRLELPSGLRQAEILLNKPVTPPTERLR